jgi:hypothetical protein
LDIFRTIDRARLTVSKGLGTVADAGPIVRELAMAMDARGVKGVKGVKGGQGGNMMIPRD